MKYISTNWQLKHTIKDKDKAVKKVTEYKRKGRDAGIIESRGVCKVYVKKK
jgi:hypothetical protein